MIEHYSHKIQNAIQKELFKASSSIKIAVAWFTNDLLFQPLLLKLGTGVRVELILNKDDINCSDENDVDFDEFVNAGGVLRWNSTKQLLHDKFCIIDDKVVIFGSYNWTNKAEYNEESIVIIKEEKDTIDFYRDKFSSLSNKYQIELRCNSTKAKEIKAINDTKVAKHSNITASPFNDSVINRIGKKNKIPWTSSKKSSPKEFTPTHIEPYHHLHFYDDIIVYGNHVIIAEQNSRMFLLDTQSFLPINNLDFKDYSIITGDYRFFPDIPYIWLLFNNKWGLYNIEKKDFSIPPICDSFRIHRQNFTDYEIVIEGKSGVANRDGYFVIDCLFDSIIFNSADAYQVKLNNKWAIFYNGRFKIEFDKRDYRGVTYKNGKFGFVSGKGIVVLDFVYDNIEYREPFGCGYYILSQKGKFGIMVAKNFKATPCIYFSENDLPINSYHGDEVILDKNAPIL